MRLLHGRVPVAHNDHVLFAVNNNYSAVERPMCEGAALEDIYSTSCRFWWNYFFELAISTHTFRALYAEGADRWRVMDA